MRKMNVKCPVCNQTHPNNHLQILDWQTTTFTCPIVNQIVNIENFVPGATTMILSPGTTEDSFNDSSVSFPLSDTVPFTQSKPPTDAVIVTVLDNLNEKIWMSPGSQFQATALAVAAGDFTDVFTFNLTNSTYQYYGPVAGNPYAVVGSTTIPYNFSHRVYLTTAKDTYIEALINNTGITLNYVDLQGTTTAFYSVTLLGQTDYNAKVDINGGVITLTVWQAIDVGMNSKITLNIVPPSVLKTPKIVEFSQNGLPAGSPSIPQKTPGYQGTSVFDYVAYAYMYCFVKYPAIIMHNVSTPLATTPIAATPL